MRKLLTSLLVSLSLVFSTVVPAFADFPLVTITGNPLAPPAGQTAPYLILNPLTGQSACSISVTGTFGGSLAVEGIYSTSQTWTGPLTVVSPDGTTTYTTITAAGSYAFNCASMIAVRADGTAATGTPTVTLNAGGGVNRVLGAGVNGGKTNVVGSGPITVTNSGNTATVGCPTCATGTPAPSNSVTSGSANVVVATPSPGVFSVSVIPPTITGSGGTTVTNPSFNTYVVSSSPVPSPTPVSVTPGSSNVTVATPSPGVFVVSVATSSPAPTPFITSGPGISVATPSANNYVISNTGSGPITAGNDIDPITNNLAPTVAVTNSPAFTGVTYIGMPGQYGDSGSGNGAILVYNGTGIGCNCGTFISSNNPNNAVSGVQGQIQALSDGNGSYALQAVDPNGDLGIYGYLAVNNLTPGQCLTSQLNPSVGGSSNAGQRIVSSGAPCGTGNGTVTSVTGTGNISITNPTTTPVVSITAAPTFAGNVTALQHYNTAAIGTLGSGCASETLVSGSTYTLTGNNYSCSSKTSGTFVVPAIGSAVSGGVPVPAGFGIHQVGTPLSISDGTNEISGLTTSATTITSTTVPFTVYSINAGAVGNTMATGAEVVTGGYDAGAARSIAAGSNIVITGTVSAPTVAVTQSPTFTGPVTVNNATGTYYTATCASCNNITKALNIINPGTGYTTNIGAGNGSISVAGVANTFLDVGGFTTGNVYLATMDINGDYGVAGYLSAGNLVSAAACLQGNTAGNILKVGAPCITSVTGSGGVAVSGSGSSSISITEAANINRSATVSTGLHTELFNTASLAAGASSGSLSFGSSFTNTPYCQATATGITYNSGIGATGAITISAVSNSAITINNGLSVATVVSVACFGV